jgi:hypothetical protein
MSEEVVELSEARAIIYLPENTVEANLSLKVYINGDIVEVHKTLGISDLRRAFEDAEDNYIEDNDKFALTEEGMKYAEELVKRDKLFNECINQVNWK